jgi:CO dehydrogenase maturation factor
MDNFDFLGFLPFNENIIEADLDGRPPYEKDPEGLKIVSQMIQGYIE